MKGALSKVPAAAAAALTYMGERHGCMAQQQGLMYMWELCYCVPQLG